MADQPPLRILSIDGGGIRGIMPAYMLMRLEEAAGQSVHELFDLIAGTSTGGLIALALTRPASRTHPDGPMVAADILALYKERGVEIFQRKPFQRTPNRVPLSEVNFRPYDSDGIKSVARDEVGSSSLCNAVKPVLIPAYDMDDRTPIWFRSWDTRSSGFSMSEVAEAATAAPTYFRPVPIRPRGERRSGYTLVDGGLFANNPALQALQETRDPSFRAVTSRHRDVGEGNAIVVSLGTGDIVVGAKKKARNEPWPNRAWVTRLLPTVLDASSEHTHQFLKREQGIDYRRIQMRIREDEKAMDDASEAGISRLEKAAEDCAKGLSADYFSVLSSLLKQQ